MLISPIVDGRKEVSRGAMRHSKKRLSKEFHTQFQENFLGQSREDKRLRILKSEGLKKSP